jgi:hypothetical protein
MDTKKNEPQIGGRLVERCLALVLRLVRRSLGEVGSPAQPDEGGCNVVGLAAAPHHFSLFTYAGE